MNCHLLVQAKQGARRMNNKRPRKTRHAAHRLNFLHMMPTDCWHHMLGFLKGKPGNLAQTCSHAHAQVWAWRKRGHVILCRGFPKEPNGPAVRAMQRHLAGVTSLTCPAVDAAVERVFPFTRKIQELVMSGTVTARLMQAIEDGCGDTLTRLVLLGGLDTGAGKAVRGEKFRVLERLWYWQHDIPIEVEELVGFSSIETMHTLHRDHAHIAFERCSDSHEGTYWYVATCPCTRSKECAVNGSRLDR